MESVESALETMAQVQPKAPGETFSVLIAGGGVAALEAVLAIAQETPDLGIELICPTPEFELRALTVGAPFGLQPPRRISLAKLCQRAGAKLRLDRLAEVWGPSRRVLLDSGEELFYDALLISPGATRHEALPGARTFGGREDVNWFGEMLDRIEHGAIHHVTFAVPTAVRWALPLYELALMTARQAQERGAQVDIAFVTHEPAPLFDLGDAASARVAELLADAGIELITARAPEAFEEGMLRLEDGELIDTSEVVSLPALSVADIPGVPQGRDGFIGTDPEMAVEGLDGVWAAGDATWFPVKQGGIAAEQADVAAASIGRRSGAAGPVPTFAPVVRCALLTGGEPEFFRFGGEDEGTASAAPLWWPPGKVAGRWLAPYLAREWSGSENDPLYPLEDLTVGAEEKDAARHREALDLALRFAAVDADQGDFGAAVRWLDVAERLNVTLPREWSQRRSEWRELSRA